MKKTFFKFAMIILSIAAFQSCNLETAGTILDPDVPLAGDAFTSPWDVEAECAGLDGIDADLIAGCDASAEEAVD